MRIAENLQKSTYNFFFLGAYSEVLSLAHKGTAKVVRKISVLDYYQSICHTNDFLHKFYAVGYGSIPNFERDKSKGGWKI
jgi:hypothetical protein